MQTKAKKILRAAGLFLWWMGAVFVSQNLVDEKHFSIDLFIEIGVRPLASTMGI